MPQLRPAARETLPSYLSRLAASKGVRTSDLAYDLLGSFKRFLLYEIEVLGALQKWTGLSDDQMTELLSWTGVPIGDVRLQFRGEPVVSRALRNPTVYGCPSCLREDALAAPADPLSMMALRGDWQLREVSICLRHRRLLVPLWTEHRPLERYDVQGQLSRIIGGIMSGEMDGDEVTPSSFDHWLDRRLSGESDPTWLSKHSTAASAAFCRMLGEGMASSGRDAKPKHERHVATAAAFAIVKQGPEAIKSYLVDLSFSASTTADPIRQTHGYMFGALENHLRDDTSFDFVRRALREAVVDIWPIADGESVLGEVHEKRRLHSIVSAASELGIAQGRLRFMLVESGAVNADDPRPDARATCDVGSVSSLSSDISQRISRKEMCDVLGATAPELAALEQAGELRPRTLMPGARMKWHAADAIKLLDELMVYCARNTPAKAAGSWVSIQVAQAQTGVDIGRILTGIRAGSIPVHYHGTPTGYRAFRVSRSAVKEFGRMSGVFQAISSGCSLAEFGRKIGLREEAQLLALVESGDIPAEKVLHPITRRAQLRVSESAMKSFESRFLTLTMIQNEFYMTRTTAIKLLKQATVRAHTPNGRDAGNVFFRCEAEEVIRRNIAANY